jgi:hypothetical protein
MPLRKGNKKFVVVAVDYSTNWTEVEALAAITTNNVIKFLWKSSCADLVYHMPW